MPTPIAHLEAVSTAAGVEVFVKRDDLSSQRYGGSKVRKLEYIFADPRLETATSMMTMGGIGSHHLVATALWCERVDRLSVLAFWQTPTPDCLHHLAALASSGCEVRYVRTRPRLVPELIRHEMVHLARGELGARAPYIIPPGATSPLGMLGYVAAAFELAAQVEAGELPPPGTIYVAAGTGGIAAGLLVGLQLAGAPWDLHLVSSVEGWAFNAVRLGWLTSRLRWLLVDAGLAQPAEFEAPAPEVRIDHGFVGEGYGVPTPAAERAVALMKDREGLELETTYTGKCFAALLAKARRYPRPALLWISANSAPLGPHVRPGWRERLPWRLRSRLPADAERIVARCVKETTTTKALSDAPS